MIPYEGQQQEITGLIPRGEPARVLPPQVAKDKAFYASALYSDSPVESYQEARQGLQENGESSFVTQSERSWMNEQQLANESTLKDIITDPSIPVEVRKNAVRQHALGLNISQNLRDKYIQKVVTEDNDTTEEDREHRQNVLIGWHNAAVDLDDQAKVVERMKLEMAAGLSGTVLDALGGIGANFVAGRYGAHVAAVEHKALNQYGPMDAWETTKSFLFPGEAMDRINKAYNAADDFGKAQIIKDIGDGLSNVPGFDYNKWEIMRDTIESPEGLNPVFRHLENIAGVLDAFALRGFFAAGITSGFMRATKQVLRNWTTIDMPVPKPRPMESSRIDPTFKREYAEGDPNPRTGVNNDPSIEGEFLGKETQRGTRRIEDEESQRVRGAKDITPQRLLLGDSGVEKTHRTASPLSMEDYYNIQRLRVDPRSPAGTTAMYNPKKAREMYTAASMDDELAEGIGTNKAEILSDSLFPKLDKDVLQHPDIANDLLKMDKYFNQVMKDGEFDPFLVPISQREKDKEVLFNSFKENKAAHYQQSNSVVRETVDNISGVAVFGRNADYGFTTAEDAAYAAKQIGEDANVVQRNGQWYVEKPYSIDYDPLETLAMGVDTVTAKFAGIDASGVARSKLGEWIFPPTQRLNPNIPQGAAMAQFRTAKVEADYMQIIEKEIKNVKHPKHLEDELIRVQENQAWESFADMRTRLAAKGLSEKDIEGVYRGYSFYKRLTDYQYHQANRVDRSEKAAANMKGIYDEAGVHIGYGSPVDADGFRSAHMVWDMDTGVAIRKPTDLEGRQFVKLETPITSNGEHYRYAIVGGKTKLGELPTFTLPKIEGYIPRMNVENFYISKVPRSLKLDGNSVTDKGELLNFSKTVGAGATRQEAEKLAERLRKEFPDHDIHVRADRSDANTSILTDHKVYKEMLDHSRKRGERLPTLYGKARLENPLEALWKSVQATVRLDQWKDYEHLFKKNWIKNYGEFTKGEFPNVLTDIKAHKNMSDEDIKQWKAAQRYFEQYTNQKYKVAVGDELWKNGFHLLADAAENVVPRWLSQGMRDVAGKGNLLVRAPRALTSALFLHLNPPRQWLVQTQQLLEWSAMSKDYMKIAPTVIPGIITAVMSKASMIGKHGDVFYNAGWKISGLSKKEFDATFKAIYDSGLPHSVDLNMMLHGAFQDAKLSLSRTNPDLGAAGNAIEQTALRMTQLIKSPAIAGKAIGYSPSELANTVGTWLFAKARWMEQNPGKNWNTPENIARITADAWEVGGSMSTRAGAMPYQDGALGLFFQFQRIGHAKFMDVFSSKKFTPKERAKLAAVRALLWGAKGIPAAGVAAWILNEHTDIMMPEEWAKFQGGLADLIANSMIDLYLSEPGDKPSDLSISAGMAPLPKTLPYADFIIAVKEALSDGRGLQSFPFVSGTGRAVKAANEIANIFKTHSHDTKEALAMSGLELAKLASGYNNYAKAMYMREFDNKANSFGTHLDIEVTRSQIVAQMFGIISKEEENLYLIQESLRDRAAFVEERAQELNKALNSHAQRYGSPDFVEWVRQQKILLSYTPEGLRRDIEQRVDQLQLKQYDTAKESAYTTIMKHIGAEEDKYLRRGLELLQNSSNPKDKEKAEEIMKLQKTMRGE